jgi:hypothetical protein
MTVQYLQEQAARAERLARSVLDQAACAALMGYARECRQKASGAPLYAIIQEAQVCSEQADAAQDQPVAVSNSAVLDETPA